MSLSIKITDRASPHIAALDADLSSPAVKHSAGQAVMRLILDHLATTDAERPNALGGRRTHFYARAGKSTSYSVHDEGATVSISQVGFAQRFFGGEIKPVNSKYLTIPARAEAHGRRAGEFDTLSVLFGKNGPYALAEREYSTFSVRKSKAHPEGRITGKQSPGGLVFFWLVKSVTQDPDPSVLPDESVILDTALSAINNYLKSRTNS